MSKSYARVYFYPSNVVTGTIMHPGPEPLLIDKKGLYVWEHDEHPPRNFSPWVLHGPFKTRARADQALERLWGHKTVQPEHY